MPAKRRPRTCRISSMRAPARAVSFHTREKEAFYYDTCLHPERTSALGHACQAQTLIVALAPCKVNGIIGRRAGSETLDCEGRVQHQPGFNRGPRRVDFTKKRQFSS